MARTALSRLTTYGTLTTNVRNDARITTTGFSLMTDALIRDYTKLVVQRWAKVLTEGGKPFYRTKENLTLIGTADLCYSKAYTTLTPYWNEGVRLVYVSTAGVRTPVNVASPTTSEELSKLANVEANSINAIQLGWGFRVFFGSAFTLTTATDVLEFSYDSQALATNGASNYLDVPDSIVPYVKEEVIDYLVKYKNLMDSNTFYTRQQERYKRALENV
jgi:hypothetical protein